jgi:hypothetical protein
MRRFPYRSITRFLLGPTAVGMHYGQPQRHPTLEVLGSTIQAMHVVAADALPVARSLSQSS